LTRRENQRRSFIIAHWIKVLADLNQLRNHVDAAKLLTTAQ